MYIVYLYMSDIRLENVITQSAVGTLAFTVFSTQSFSNQSPLFSLYHDFFLVYFSISPTKKNWFILYLLSARHRIWSMGDVNKFRWRGTALKSLSAFFPLA